jgi:ribosomal protein S27AE
MQKYKLQYQIVCASVECMIKPVPQRTVGFLLRTLGGATDVHLFRNEVRGKFSTKLQQICQRHLITPFVNLPNDSDSVTQFTELYGALTREAKPGVEFQFSLQEFKDAQDQFRNMWRNPRQYTGSPFDLMKELGGSVQLHKGSIIYIAPTLYKYLYADLLLTPERELRICRRVECTHPYFVAEHLNRQFCGTTCAQEHRREENKEWWQVHGKSWRSNRDRKISD